MITEFSGEYLNYDGTEDGDICTFLDEGKMEFSETLKKELFNIKVDHNGKTKTYSPSNIAGRALQASYGKDSKNWVGKQFQVLHIDKKLVIRPINQKI